MAAFFCLPTARHAACCSVLRGTSACERRSYLTSFRHQDMDDVVNAVPCVSSDAASASEWLTASGANPAVPEPPQTAHHRHSPEPAPDLRDIAR